MQTRRSGMRGDVFQAIGEDAVASADTTVKGEGFSVLLPNNQSPNFYNSREDPWEREDVGQ